MIFHSSRAAASAIQEPIAETTSISEYPNTAGGLKGLISDLIRDANQKDGNGAAALFRSLEIPNHAAWFTAKFGSQEGPSLARQYEKEWPSHPDSLRAFLNGFNQWTQITVSMESFRSEWNPRYLHDFVFRAMKEPNPIYTAKLANCAGVFTIGDFLFIDGRFRVVDPLVWNALSTVPAIPVISAKRFPLLQKISNSQPVYPQDAKDHHIQGTVRMDAIIATNGTIRDIRVISGNPALIQAAVAAVSRWRFAPLWRKGQPVEVKTAISVDFRLEQ